ncbi:MAG: NUDIX domain-containing protein [bacterium]|nr:NUDIX domain-containing protein [bacterium]
MDYTERKTAKAVIINDQGETLTFGSVLIGGGVEENETYEEALHREALEEAAIAISILKHLGECIGYLDIQKRKYIVNAYLCKYIDAVGARTSNDSMEIDRPLVWDRPQETIERFRQEIEALQHADQSVKEDIEYQSRLYNRQISLAFLKEAFK